MEKQSSGIPLAIAVLAAIAGSASESARADYLMCVTSAGNVYSVSTADGSATLVGSNPGSNFRCLARSTAGVYYANDWGNFNLTTIDPVTGLRGADIGGLAARGLSFSPSDVLYGFGDDSGPDQLITINTVNGTTTSIGARFGQIFAMDFVGSTLYAWQDGVGLVTVNTTDGTLTDVNPLEAGTITGLGSIGSTLYGVVGNSLYSINTTTGAQTLIGSDPGVIGGYEGVEGPLTALPEPSALVLAAFGLLGVAMVARRKISRLA